MWAKKDCLTNEVDDMCIGQIGCPECSVFFFLHGFYFDVSFFMTPPLASGISEWDFPLFREPSVLPPGIQDKVDPLEPDTFPYGDYIKEEYMETNQTIDLDDVHSPQSDDTVSFPTIENQLVTTNFVEAPKKIGRPKRRKHIEPQYCTMCKEKFRRPRDLNRHVKRHTRPVHCEKCDVSMAERRDLDRHYWASHPGYAVRLGLRPPEQPQCGVCNKRFTRKDNLTRHSRKYHGDAGSRGARL